MNLRLLVFCVIIILIGSGYAQGHQLNPAENLTVQNGFCGGAILTWDSSGSAQGYHVYKSLDGLPFAKVATVRNNGFMDWWIFPDHIFQYYVTAYTKDGDTVVESQPSNIVMFAMGNHHYPLPGEGVIGGKVTDDGTGMPIRGAVVRFFRPGKLWAEQTHTDSSGIYWAALDTGRYLIRADKYDYFGEWYDNVLRVDSASVVTLHQDSLAIANFSLRHVPWPVPVAVSGVVTDSASGQPLQNSFVAFLRPHKWLRELQIVTGLFGGFLSERIDLPELGRLHGVVWAGRTDEQGRYNATVVRGMKYIALAFKPGYVPEFFDNKYTPFEANRLRFMQDTGGIDFKLIMNPLAVHSLYGTVRDSSGLEVPSHMILYRKTVLGRLAVRFTMTDSAGNFEFHDLVSGVFYLKAVPINGYAPSWHSSYECGVRNWRFADTIQVNGDRVGIEVCVKNSLRSGFARIAGSVERDDGNLSAVVPAQGVTVYALSNLTGEVAGYDITEDDGTYSIENLPAGSYAIVADKEDLAPVNLPDVTVDETNNYEGNDIVITLGFEPTGAIEGNEMVPEVYNLYQNYPNPFNPSTSIRFDLPVSSSIAVCIFNLIGQQVAVLLEGKLDAGSHSVKWDAGQAGTGIYFVKVVATPADGSGSTFTQVRKMILMR